MLANVQGGTASTNGLQGADNEGNRSRTADGGSR